MIKYPVLCRGRNFNPFKFGWLRYFVCLEFNVLLRIFSFIWRSHHYQWWASNFDQYSYSLIIRSELECSWASDTYCDTGHPFIMVISEDLWHSLLQSVWQQSCQYLFLRLTSVTAEILTSNLPHMRRTLYPTKLPSRWCWLRQKDWEQSSNITLCN